MHYAARVIVPAPVYGVINEDGDEMTLGWSLREIMVDNIKTRREGRARRIARAYAKKHIRHLWDNKMPQGMPGPEIHDISKIDEDGKPIKPKFPTPKETTPRLMVMNSGKITGATKQPAPLDSKETGAANKVIKQLPAPVKFTLSDPFTETIIKLAKED